MPLLRWLLLVVWAPSLASAFGRLSNLFTRDAAARALEEDDGCTDSADPGPAQCKIWADAGECQSNYGWMKARCVKACNLCKPKPYQDHATLAACKDADHSCSHWSREARPHGQWAVLVVVVPQLAGSSWLGCLVLATMPRSTALR